MQTWDVAWETVPLGKTYRRKGTECSSQNLRACILLGPERVRDAHKEYRYGDKEESDGHGSWELRKFPPGPLVVSKPRKFNEVKAEKAEHPSIRFPYKNNVSWCLSITEHCTLWEVTWAAMYLMSSWPASQVSKIFVWILFLHIISKILKKGQCLSFKGRFWKFPESFQTKCSVKNWWLTCITMLDRKMKCDYFVTGPSHWCKGKGLQKYGKWFSECSHEFLGNELLRGLMVFLLFQDRWALGWVPRIPTDLCHKRVL